MLTVLVPEFHQRCERVGVWEGQRPCSQSSVAAWEHRGRTKGWSGTDMRAETAVSARTEPVSIGHGDCETSKQNIPEINVAHVEMALGMKGTSVSQVTVVCGALHRGLERECVRVFGRKGRREQKACDMSTSGFQEPKRYPRNHQLHIVTRPQSASVAP